MKNLPNKIGLALIILVNIIGAIGFRYDIFLPLFKLLTPYNLLLTLVICLFYVPFKKFILPFIYVFTIGYVLEIVGVETKLLFGDYDYNGSVLGTQLFNVPLIIGVNWFILTIGTRACANWLTKSTYLQIVYAAILMVGLDILIEPIAIQYKFWNWAQHDAPKQNYLMWFIASIVMQAIITKKSSLIPYSLGFTIVASQLIFFVSLHV
ncbi:MAG: carotene biosynthesis protein [Crocinitomicaceae bacterium]|nr:carotene biosynthesis protein [Crocinitomicaceae bacterium]